ncbi:type II secretion system minor pseudopilin GspK [Crenobacter cavernae]|uniref:Type II secretion system protein K n=1 Tax=Crenobacter cavernae TaxID=2290923 RepID=A0A345Y9G8_9NEIS|nr:type II secretion system minor pseudopilin GspK [Crenobacter cavernae]AXK40570.1 general secretion pathway protein GspK [Crenobacter cavernae]
MRRERGMAVVMALLLVGLAASASALVLWQQGLWWQRVATDHRRAQVRAVSDAGLAWGREVLRFDAETTANDHLAELWAQIMPETKIETMTLSGSLADAQGRFNLNNLVKGGRADVAQLALFRRLLTRLGQPQELAGRILQRLGIAAQPQGDETEPPVNLAKPLKRLENLLALEGFDTKTLAALAPHVTVLPDAGTTINPNTATPELMAALLPGADPGALAFVVRSRLAQPFKDGADFTARLPRGAAPPDVPTDAASRFFELDGRLKGEDERYRLTALFERRSGVVVARWHDMRPATETTE